MIGSLTYEEMLKLSEDLAKSSESIRSIINKYDSDSIKNVVGFCDSIDSYSRFLNSSVELFKDSDEALKVMIEKNK